MQTIGSVPATLRMRVVGGSTASAVSFASTARSGGRLGRSFAPAAARTASQTRTEDSIRNWRVSTRGLGRTSTAPASSTSNRLREPWSVSVEQMITGIGRCAMILRRKVSPSIRGISRSRMMTSGTSSWMRRAAMNGSAAVPSTVMSGAASRMPTKVCRTEAESSTISTRIGGLRVIRWRPRPG